MSLKDPDSTKMNRKRTTNQLTSTPIRMPKTRKSWMELPPRSMGLMVPQGLEGRTQRAKGRADVPAFCPLPAAFTRAAAVCRSTIAPKSVPAGNVPNAWPPSPASREAQNASATRGRRGARAASPGARGPSARRPGGRGPRSPRGRQNSSRSSPTKASRRGSAPAASSTSPKNASSVCGLLGQGAQDVERDHVARALPDPVQRAVAVAGAASPTPRRSRCRRSTRAPRRRAPARACRSSTSRPRWRGA